MKKRREKKVCNQQCKLEREDEIISIVYIENGNTNKIQQSIEYCAVSKTNEFKSKNAKEK